MKKIFLFAAAAALLTACSSEELAEQSIAKQDANGTPINFSVYTPRTTRSGLPSNNGVGSYGLTTDKLKTQGFGLMAFYTDDEKYDVDKSTPNFMYNTKVTCPSGSTWEYKPVMYWPNEFKDATAANIDRISFFAYAPYVEVENTTGIPYVKQTGTDWLDDKTLVDNDEKNIVALSKNSATGNPFVKYVVDTDPKTSVDLLWGVAADDAATKYVPINNTKSNVTVTPGKPFIDLVKPTLAASTPEQNLVRFNMCHALSQLNISIRYASDVNTPDAGLTSAEIKPEQTRIYVRSIKIGGFIMKAALDLNSIERYDLGGDKYRGKANWKDFSDGKSALTSDDNTTFFDGRKDGKEGTEGGENSNEKYLGLNKYIVENYVNDTWGGTTWLKAETDGGKNRGVTKAAQNLFGDGTAQPTDPIYVIPVNEEINIEIEYDVLTADPALFDTMSDGLTKGSMIKNRISKTSKEIFGTTDAVKMQDGKGYTINIILGMTSAKIEATVTAWGNESAVANLPQNQD